MSKPDTNKIRLLAVYNMILRGRRITASQILRELDLYFDIQVDRKTIYNDLWAIDRLCPIDIQSGRNGGFCKLDVLAGCNDNR